MFLNPVTEIECCRIISCLKNTKVSLDCISLRIFKEFSYSYIHIICDIINLCFHNGKFPDSLKIARIIPIHKKGDLNDINNYRPIAILPFFSKIIEKCIYSRLLDFLNRNNFYLPINMDLGLGFLQMMPY